MKVFEKLLLKEKITFIVGRVHHPETNGKILRDIPAEDAPV
ncbi:MAG: hypothetical protein QXL71_09085 [Candidatus Bathyarchaeia archaeon]